MFRMLRGRSINARSWAGSNLTIMYKLTTRERQRTLADAEPQLLAAPSHRPDLPHFPNHSQAGNQTVEFPFFVYAGHFRVDWKAKGCGRVGGGSSLAPKP